MREETNEDNTKNKVRLGGADVDEKVEDVLPPDLDDADDHHTATEKQDAQDVLWEGGHERELQVGDMVVRSRRTGRSYVCNTGTLGLVLTVYGRKVMSIIQAWK